jgi:hypothetical protein
MNVGPRRLPRSVYYSRLNSEAVASSFAPWTQVKPRLATTPQRAAEALVVAPHVTFSITNDVSYANLPLLLLTDFLGFEAVRDLLRERAIRFLCHTSAVQLTTGPAGLDSDRHPLGLEAESLPGLSDRDGERLASGAIDGDVYRGWATSNSLTTDQRRELVTLAAEVTEFAREEAAEEAVDLALIAFNQPSSRLIGFSLANYPDHRIPDRERQRALAIAADIFSASALREYELNLFEEQAGWKSLVEAVKSVFASPSVLDTTTTILELERVSSVANLLRSGVIQPSEIVRLRHERGAEEFRRWLWAQPNPLDRDAVVQSYTAAILRGNERVAESTWFRTLKVSIMEFVGTLVETGAKAVLADKVAPELVEWGARLARWGVEVGGELTVDKLATGAEPRQFADTVRRLEVERTLRGPQLVA